jgi:glycosyltransferase involved in cell wall biosynthesis
LDPHVLYVGGEDHHLRIPAMLALRECGFRITAAGTGNPEPFRLVGLEFLSFPLERFLAPLADWKTCNALAKLLEQVGPDIVQSFDSKLGILLPIAARRSPCLVVIRTINGRGWVYSSRAPLALALRPIYRTLHRIAAGSTAATVFEIGEDREFFQKHGLLGLSRGVQVPGAGVDVEGFDQAFAGSPSPTELRMELGLGSAEVVITVTRMTRQKGIPTLLKSAALVHRTHPNVRFLLVGPRQSEGPLAVSEAEIARHSPYVIATGPRSDVPALLRLSDVFAFPTEYREGVPRVLLEAALAELPIVTTGIAGCADVIEDGWSGLIAPVRHPSALAERVVYMLENKQKARTMAARAGDLVRREFSLQRVVECQATLYRELLDRSSLPTGRAASRPSLIISRAAE